MATLRKKTFKQDTSNQKSSKKSMEKKKQDRKQEVTNVGLVQETNMTKNPIPITRPYRRLKTDKSDAIMLSQTETGLIIANVRENGIARRVSANPDKNNQFAKYINRFRRLVEENPEMTKKTYYLHNK